MARILTTYVHALYVWQAVECSLILFGKTECVFDMISAQNNCVFDMISAQNNYDPVHGQKSMAAYGMIASCFIRFAQWNSFMAFCANALPDNVAF